MTTALHIAIMRAGMILRHARHRARHVAELLVAAGMSVRDAFLYVLDAARRVPA